MLNVIQHLIKSISYETLKQVQGDRSGLFTWQSGVLFFFECLVIVYRGDWHEICY
jgi:hypothetical protein